MTPYYAQDGIVIYHGDCRDVLPEIGRKSVDLVLTDPPYAIGAGRGEWAATAGVAIGLHLAAQCVREKGAMLCFSTSSGRGIEFTQGAIGKTLPLNRLLLWHKALSTSKAAGPWKWDLVTILAFGRATFGTAGASAMLSTTEPRLGREHPSQVPLDVASWLYRPFAEEGGLHSSAHCTLDPFMGSGRLLMPAAEMARGVIGIDIEERYCELAARNLTKARASYEPQPSEVA